MKIIVDVDDVVADLVTAWLNAYNEDWDDNLNRNDITEWDMIPFVKEECGAQIYDYLKEPGLYKNVKPITGAWAGVKTLQMMGDTILFVTAGSFLGEKQEWLEQLQFMGENTYFIATKNKELIPADIIIDDRVDNLISHSAIGILFDRPHNRNVDWDGRRAVDWDDVLEQISEIEEAAKKPIKLEVQNKVINLGGGLESLSNPRPGIVVDNMDADTIMVPKPGEMIFIPGLGKDAPTVVNENGGRQSELKYRFDLMYAPAMFSLANILAEGADKYGEWNWAKIGIHENVNHALSHIYAYLAGDGQDDHLGHAFCRMMFAKSIELGLTDDSVPEKA
jgi:5'(3')-deoxyribonucleotidase